MTEAMYYVLLALMSPNHGYQLMNAVAQVSKGRIRMGPGTLYGVLGRMQKDGFIMVVKDNGRRKTYGMTEVGKAALKQEYQRLVCLVEDGRLLREEKRNE
ncbi:PadR family transcriptional regulator [Petroclostridium sp. X23]|uniref:PadR family transcriptional regulator n=1 Tax=Petroclostridium sp. X23 TaxID=3045146 RepID=UPI0024AE7C08|nr:PadR family transcriptional regulator [Petroclostridium sp. X23]WHH57674.1 PadR family transcriptional regulator [Petroclostridium sp. X23]